MARPNDEFLLAWASLSADETTPGWQAIALPSAGPVDVLVGRRSPDNAEAILLGFPSARLPPAQKLPEGQGFNVDRADPKGIQQLRLALTRRSAGSKELFATMVCDVVGALDEGASAGATEKQLLQLFLGRVGAWQEFMRKGSQLLSPEAEIGLVGELVMLRAIIDAGVAPTSAVEGWVGPLDGSQDFEIGMGALEVKASLSVAGFTAKIGSLEQLDDSARQPLFLVGTRLHQTETGQSLPEQVAEIRDVVSGDPEATRLLTERLIAAGYSDAHANNYIRRFALIETIVFEVMEGFPRITPGNIPLGISKATYEIDLSKVTGPSISTADALKKLGVI